MIRNRNITVIGYSLSLLYLSSFFVYLNTLTYPPFLGHGLVIAVMFLALMVCSIGVVRAKDWARKGIVGINALMFVYFIFLYSRFPVFIQPAYMYLNLIIALYFAQKKVHRQFDPDWKYSRKSVLLVDDDDGLVKTVKNILLRNGYSVLTANNGERGLQVARVQKPDLILLDVIMPGIKGRDVCAKLKDDEETKHIPVVFLTAKDSPDDIRAEMELGAASHLTKPVNPKVLLTEIRQLIDKDE